VIFVHVPIHVSRVRASPTAVWPIVLRVGMVIEGTAPIRNGSDGVSHVHGGRRSDRSHLSLVDNSNRAGASENSMNRLGEELGKRTPRRTPPGERGYTEILLDILRGLLIKRIKRIGFGFRDFENYDSSDSGGAATSSDHY